MSKNKKEYANDNELKINSLSSNKAIYAKIKLKNFLTNLPIDIQKDKNFVTWIEVKKSNGKANKIPASIETGKVFSPGTNAHLKPEFWTDLKTLLKKDHHRALYFTSKSNSRIMIDLDDCVSWENGKPNIIPEAKSILNKFGSYSELSPSSEGIRIIVNGKTPLDKGYRGVKQSIDGKEVGFEIIAYGRGATLTGNVLDGFDIPVKDNQEAIDWYCQKYLLKYITSVRLRMLKNVIDL